MSESNQIDSQGMPAGVDGSSNQITSDGMPAEREATKRIESEMDRMC
jgi:hypothetical protein